MNGIRIILKSDYHHKRAGFVWVDALWMNFFAQLKRRATLLPFIPPDFQQESEKQCGKFLCDEGNHP
jgi:hypothetical protein